jgi:hypothetical protein
VIPTRSIHRELAVRQICDVRSKLAFDTLACDMDINLKALTEIGSDARLALAVACGLFLILVHFGVISDLPSWMIPAAWIGLLMFGCLVAVEILGAWIATRLDK